MGRPDGRSPSPLRLARIWRNARVTRTCPHWQKRRSLPLFTLKRFLARVSKMSQSSADGAAEPIVGQRPVRACKAFVTRLDQDKDTKAWLLLQNRETKHMLRAYSHMESKAMRREDHAGRLLRRAEASEAYVQRLKQMVQRLEAEIRIVAATSKDSRPSTQPLFSVGQSVLQWWASYFKTNGAPPKGKRSKKRPEWYSGEIVRAPVWTDDMLYNNDRFKGWVYPTK